MRISIVTISFNQARFLRTCIESVITQGIEDLEYILVDPGSTDGSRDIVDSYGDSIRRIYEKDAGPADGLNKGFALANGDVFGFLNADDALLPGSLENVRARFAARPDLDVLCGSGYIIDADGLRRSHVVASRFTPWLYAHGAVTVFQQGVFFRAEQFRKAGGFNVNNRTCWDGELFLEMAIRGARYDSVAADLALFRIHDDSISGSGRLNSAYEGDCERLFTRVTGRRRREADHLLDAVARVAKYVGDPSYAVRRLMSR
jgi:glycosyltransferase involved in cell wall biosynthesis